MKPTVWNLQTKAGRRFRSGHPWVFANELKESPKGLVPGSPVELRDERGVLLARGYGNPHSLICFRTLSRGQSEDPWRLNFLANQVLGAAKWRKQIGLSSFSHRLVFGEADQLPGLVMDRFIDQKNSGQVLVLQLLTAGMEQLIPNVAEWVGQWVKDATGLEIESTAIVIRRDVGARKLEGLEFREPEVIQNQIRHSLKNFPAWIRSGLGDGGLEFTVDLVGGQKTGFFFDQASNVQSLLQWIPQGSRPTTVLDLFCYVGQWGSQIASAVRSFGGSANVHLVDGSQSALTLAKLNVEAQGGQAQIYERDIMDGLAGIPESDIVICDPPAFIKSKKDHGAGLRGYVKANAMAMGKLNPGGWMVCCSCSHHLSDSDFVDVLRQAEERAGIQINWVARGIQAPDHPVLLGFPEGQYLKAWIGRRR